MIAGLIDKLDSFEIVRDKIALILAAEVASQMQLAIDDGKDPDLWNLRVFLERSNPWEQLLNNQSDTFPIINVWYDNSTFDKSGSNITERQKVVGIFNIDCYGFAVSEDDGAGHKPGDKESALEVHRALRLVRNILMAAKYNWLDLRGLVWQRWTQSVTIFQPQLENNAIPQVVGARLALSVTFNEFSEQIPTEILEQLSIDVFRAEDGEIVLEADYIYPL